MNSQSIAADLTRQQKASLAHQHVVKTWKAGLLLAGSVLILAGVILFGAMANSPR